MKHPIAILAILVGLPGAATATPAPRDGWQDPYNPPTPARNARPTPRDAPRRGAQPEPSRGAQPTARRATLAARREVLGTEHEDTLDSLEGVALIVFQQGKLLEAESLTRELLELRQHHAHVVKLPLQLAATHEGPLFLRLQCGQQVLAQ